MCGESGNIRQRDELFDAVKGIGIFLVTAKYLLSGTSIAQECIAACHMPVFFFVSGYFFIGSYQKYSVGAFVQKKVKTLLVPYFCWSLVSLLMNGIPYIIYRDFSGLCTDFKEIFIYARSVWFLVVLFLTDMFYYIIKKCSEHMKCSQYLLAMGCLILFVFMVIKTGCWQFISIYKSEWLFPYFLLGSACREMGVLEKIQKHVMHNWSIFVCGGVYLIIIIGFYNQSSAYIEFYSGFLLNICHIGYYLVFYIEGCIGIIIIFMAAKMTGHVSGYAAKAGRYSLDVYVLHMFFVKIMQAVSGRFEDCLVYYNYVIVPIYSLAVTALIVFVSEHVLRKSVFYRFSIGGGTLERV